MGRPKIHLRTQKIVIEVGKVCDVLLPDGTIKTFPSVKATERFLLKYIHSRTEGFGVCITHLDWRKK